MTLPQIRPGCLRGLWGFLEPPVGYLCTVTAAMGRSVNPEVATLISTEIDVDINGPRVSFQQTHSLYHTDHTF